MGSTADWDPDQYERFKAERARPFWDLAAMLDRSVSPDRLVDLGCGTGELTAALVRDTGAARATGIDNSSAMLERATEHESDVLRFVEGDIATWTSEGDHDIVFSNAALHWIPDHQRVLRCWSSALRSGGQLAVQVPANSDHPSHLVSARVARTEPFLSAMGGEPPPDPVAHNVLAPEGYARLLHDLGFVEQQVRLQVYGHVLPSTSAVVEWVRGSSLTRFFRVLPSELHEPFVDAFRLALLDELGDQRPFFYPFKRILIRARASTTRR
jgi:trans-aconitate 2-methyltransferase